MNKLSKIEIKNIVLSGIFNIGYGLATLFLNVYLFSYTGSLIMMSIYTFIRIGLFPFFYLVSYKITQKRSFVVTYSIGLSLMTCSLLYALLGEELFKINGAYVLGAAFITGIGEGFFWYSRNTCDQIITSIQSRALYLSITGIVSNVSNLLVPIISDIVMKYSPNDSAGNRTVLILAVIFYLSVIIISFGINAKPQDKNGNLKGILSLKDKKWADHNIVTLLFGMKDSLTLTLTGILVYNAAGNGGIYSKLQILFAIIQIIGFRFLIKALGKENINKTFVFGTFCTISSILVLVYFPNIYGAIYFGIANSLSTVFYNNSYSYISANIIATYKDEMTAKVVSRETFLSIGRCAGMSLIVILYLFIKDDIYLPISVTLLSIAPIFVYKIMIKYK